MESPLLRYLAMDAPAEIAFSGLPEFIHRIE